MATTKIVCPDCGGVIGETGPGESPCTCFAGPPANPSKSDTATLDSLSNNEKVCFICGKNVIGHRRIKDSRGYMCYPCAKEQRKAEKEGKVACKECRRLVKPAGLVAWEGKMICRKCYGDHQETAKFKKKISTVHYDRHEKQRLLVLGGIFLVLACFVVYGLLKRKYGS